MLPGRPYLRKFSCYIHVGAFRSLRELKCKTPKDQRHFTKAWLIHIALHYLNDHSPYGLDVNGLPREKPFPQKTRRPVLRLVAKETGKET